MTAVTEAEIAILRIHLPYELDMFEAAFVFLHSTDLAAARENGFIKNAAIEAFWTHARNLIEFLMESRKAKHTDVVPARTFAKDYTDSLEIKSIKIMVNKQISHLTYERVDAPEGKLGGQEMLLVKQAIDAEIRRLEESLEDRYRELWVPRRPSEWIEAGTDPAATDQVTSEVTT